MSAHFKTQLKSLLKSELPGSAAHSIIMPERKIYTTKDAILKKARKSAVLLLMFPKEDQIYITYIVRSTYKGVHSAQVSFPGGKMEIGDDNLEQTALREAKEELNINPDEIEVLGQLSALYVPPSNFLIQPFIAYQPTEPKFLLQEREVAGVINYPINKLLAKSAMIQSTVKTANGEKKVKGFLLENHLLWGATAMITSELISILNRGSQ